MTPATNSSNEPPKLQRNTLQLRHAVVMAVAAMSPVGAIFFNTVPQAGLVGAAMPLCYIISFGVALLVADQISIMAAEFPASGSLYTFVTQGLGVRWGFLVGWLSLISFGVAAVPSILAAVSANFQQLARPNTLNIIGRARMPTPQDGYSNFWQSLSSECRIQSLENLFSQLICVLIGNG